MSNASEIERIRARVADEYWQAIDEAMHAAHGRQDGLFFDMALADLNTLLSALDAQAAVIEAAAEVVADASYNPRITGPKMKALHDALARKALEAGRAG